MLFVRGQEQIKKCIRSLRSSRASEGRQSRLARGRRSGIETGDTVGSSDEPTNDLFVIRRPSANAIGPLVVGGGEASRESGKESQVILFPRRNASGTQVAEERACVRFPHAEANIRS